MANESELMQVRFEKEEKINFSEDDFNELTKKTNKKMRIII